MIFNGEQARRDPATRHILFSAMLRYCMPRDIERRDIDCYAIRRWRCRRCRLLPLRAVDIRRLPDAAAIRAAEATSVTCCRALMPALRDAATIRCCHDDMMPIVTRCAARDATYVIAYDVKSALLRYVDIYSFCRATPRPIIAAYHVAAGISPTPISPSLAAAHCLLTFYTRRHDMLYRQAQTVQAAEARARRMLSAREGRE